LPGQKAPRKAIRARRIRNFVNPSILGTSVDFGFSMKKADFFILIKRFLKG
jgi:hypothetical protein